MARLPAAAKGRSLPPAQAAAWMNEFLALEQRENAGGAPAAMKNFLKAGAWLGASSDHPLAREVLDRYPQVLLSAARQAAAEFTAAQPEADLEAMLGMEDCSGRGWPRSGPCGTSPRPSAPASPCSSP